MGRRIIAYDQGEVIDLDEDQIYDPFPPEPKKEEKKEEKEKKEE